MKSLPLFSLLLSLFVTLSACSGYSNILRQDRNGGTLILVGSEDGALEDAYKRMAAHCGQGNFEVVGRELVTVGQEEYTQASTGYQEQLDHSNQRRSNRSHSATYAEGGSTTSAVSGVREVRENRIYYECLN